MMFGAEKTCKARYQDYVCNLSAGHEGSHSALSKERWYIVNVREVHIQMVRVQAVGPEEAIQKVADGEGETVDDGLEYSHTMDREFWTVEKEDKSWFGGEKDEPSAS